MQVAPFSFLPVSLGIPFRADRVSGQQRHHMGGVATYKIERARLAEGDRFVVMVSHEDGTTTWSPWFEHKSQAERWIVEQTTNRPHAFDG